MPYVCVYTSKLLPSSLSPPAAPFLTLGLVKYSRSLERRLLKASFLAVELTGLAGSVLFLRTCAQRSSNDYVGEEGCSGDCGCAAFVDSVSYVEEVRRVTMAPGAR